MSRTNAAPAQPNSRPVPAVPRPDGLHRKTRMQTRVGRPDRRARTRGISQHDPPRATLSATIFERFRESPGLRLRLDGAASLFGLSLETCSAVLDSLVAEGLIRHGADGFYSFVEAESAAARTTPTASAAHGHRVRDLGR